MFKKSRHLLLTAVLATLLASFAYGSVEVQERCELLLLEVASKGGYEKLNFEDFIEKSIHQPAVTAPDLLLALTELRISFSESIRLFNEGWECSKSYFYFIRHSTPESNQGRFQEMLASGKRIKDFRMRLLPFAISVTHAMNQRLLGKPVRFVDLGGKEIRGKLYGVGHNVALGTNLVIVVEIGPNVLDHVSLFEVNPTDISQALGLNTSSSIQ